MLQILDIVLFFYAHSLYQLPYAPEMSSCAAKFLKILIINKLI